MVVFRTASDVSFFCGKVMGEGSEERSHWHCYGNSLSHWVVSVEWMLHQSVFLNVKDVGLKCGVIFRHYEDVRICNTKMLGALKRIDNNRGRSTI